MYYKYDTPKLEGDSTLEEQEQQLKANGATIIFKDSFTGTKLDRPEFDKLRSQIKPGDTLIVTKLDRIARSALQGSELVQSFISEGIKVHVLNMGIMDNTPTGKLIMNVMFAFAEFERDMIVQRTSEGKEIAKQSEDYREGRPKVELDPVVFGEILRKQQDGKMSVKECCEVLNIARSTWYNKVKEVAVC